jgi:hypothetical protein
MGVVFPDAFGVASYPGRLTPNPIHIAGAPVLTADADEALPVLVPRHHAGVLQHGGAQHVEWACECLGA